MLELALKGEPAFAIDLRELAPEASGYTVDTLRSFREELGEKAVVYFLLGADQLEKLATWREPQEVKRLAKLAAFERPGHAVRDPDVTLIPMAPMPVSASEIRGRAARGESLDGLVPPAVAEYIERHGLYR